MRLKNERRAAENLRTLSRRRAGSVSMERRLLRRSSNSPAPRLTFAQVSALLAASAALVGSSLVAKPVHAQTWIGTTGNWSDPNNWLNGTVPTSPASALTFTEAKEAGGVDDYGRGYEAFNDLATPFRFNALNFVGTGFFAITLTGNSLSTTGANPTISQNGLSPAILSQSLILAPSSGTTTIGGSGLGSLTLGRISGSGGLNINQSGAILNASGYPVGGSVVNLGGGSTFTGGVTLTRGNLSLDSSVALGDAGNTLTITDGANSTLRLPSSLTVIANNINVTSGPLNLFATNATTTGTLAGAITGANGLNSYGTDIIRLTGANTLTGPILLTGETVLTNVNVNSATGGGISLGGNTVIGAGSTLSIVKNASLVLDNTTVYNADRVADSIGLNLNNGRFQYNSAGAAAPASTETLGAVSAAGLNTISLGADSTNGANATLNFGAISRGDNAQLNFRGALNGETSATSSQVFFENGLTTISAPNTSGTGVYTGIVPFASFTPSPTGIFPQGLVTYDAATGVRGLASNDPSVFNQVFSGDTLLDGANNTVRSGVVEISSNIVNSLYVDSDATFVGGSLEVVSGAIAVYTGATFNGPLINFGGNTGYFHLSGTTTITGESRIIGASGVVVGGFRSDYFVSPYLDLNNSNADGNPFSGGLFINGNAGVRFNTGDSQLGAAGGAIRLNGGTLAYTGDAATSLDASRPVFVGAAGGGINSTSTASGAAFTVPNNITGNGDLVKFGRGVLALTGNNSGLTGNTILQEGTLQFSPGALPSGSLIVSGGGFAKLIPLATNTFTAPVVLLTSVDMATGAGITQTFSGGLSGSGLLFKSGDGTLRLTGAGGFAGILRITGGGVTLSGGGAVNSREVEVVSSEILLDNAAGGVNFNRLSDTGTVYLVNGGQFRLIGSANTAITENVSVLALRGTGNEITVDATGGAATTLAFAGFAPRIGSSVVFAGNNLGLGGSTGPRILLGGQATGYIFNARVREVLGSTGTQQAFYDPIQGVRGAFDTDFDTRTTIQNAAPTNTPTTANVRVQTTSATAGAANTINSLRISPGATLNAASGMLTLTSGGVYTDLGTPAANISGGTLAAGTGKALSFSADGDLNVSSALTGASGLVKIGNGTLSLTGSYGVTGPLRVDQGSLTTNGTNVAADAVNVGLGATLSVGALSATNNVEVSRGALNASSLNVAGRFLVNAATVSATGAVTAGGFISLDPFGSIASSLNAGSITTPILRVNAGTVTTTGGVTARVVDVLPGSALTTGGGLFINAGGSVFGPVTFTGAQGLTLQGAATVNGSLNYTSDAQGGKFPITASSSATVAADINLSYSGGVQRKFNIPGGNNQTVTLSGRISSGPNSTGITSFGGNANDSNTWLLTNATNDFRGAVFIEQGTVAITSDGALGDPGNPIVTITDQASIGALRFDADNITLNPQRDINIITLTAINTNGNNAEIQGKFISGNNSTSPFFKIGAGMLSLSSASNTYTGTFTASEGTLAVNGVFLNPFVAQGGTIGGNGTAGPLTVSANGMIAPGNSIGTLSATSLLFNGGGALTIELGADGVSDLLTLSGALTQGSAGAYTLNFLDAGGLADGNEYTFLNFASTTFDFGGSSSPFSLNLPAGFNGVVTQDGNSLTLAVVAVPEPGSIAFLLGPGALGMFMVARNRRRRDGSEKAA